MSEKFSATESLVGYLYQCEYALLESIKRLNPTESFSVYLEIYDDVTFESSDNVIELLQTKHHISSSKKLTDSSVDLWKSIRIWIESFKELNENTMFFLITTENVSLDSVAKYLGVINRDIMLTILSLNSVAETSQNKTNGSAYTAYKTLTQVEKENLFNRVFIICNEVTIDNIDLELKRHLVHAVKLKYIDSFISRLKGYWYKRLVISLTNKKLVKITSQELFAEIDYLRDEISDENLPIDDDILTAVIDESGYLNHVFVHQMNLIELSKRRIYRAIRDYFRASEQRSKWIREELLYIDELDRYEHRLVEAWERHFDMLAEDLDEEALEKEKIQMGKEIFKWIESNIFPLRKCNESFISIGTFHILADQLKIGWHPDYSTKLFTYFNNRDN